MRGDLILYEAVAGVPFDWLIAHFTHGKFAHVEIDLGDGTMVSEHGNGLTRSNLDSKRPHVLVHPKGNIEAGIAWVSRELLAAQKDGEVHEYGWLDIFTEAVKVLGGKLTVGAEGQWDCSDFATRYLLAADAAGPLGDAAANPGSVSPNDLARAFGVPVK